MGKVHIGEGLSLGVSLGHTGVRKLGGHSSDDYSTALRPLIFAALLLGLSQVQRILDGHCLPTENNLTVKPVKKTGKKKH